MMMGMLAFWLLIPLAAVWLLRGDGSSDRTDPDRALRILQERFARGEIDAAEYETRRKLIHGEAA